MIQNQTNLILKDSSSIKGIKCISTLNKKTIKNNSQFKAVITNSNHISLKKGSLINAILMNSSFNQVNFSGKVKKFNKNEALQTKELKKNNLLLIGNRVYGLQNFNLNFYLKKKDNLLLDKCK